LLVKKKVRELAKRFRGLRHLELSHEASLLYAWCFLASPDERWERMRIQMRLTRSLPSLTPTETVSIALRAIEEMAGKRKKK
jgi:hypothetical protein